MEHLWNGTDKVKRYFFRRKNYVIATTIHMGSPEVKHYPPNWEECAGYSPHVSMGSYKDFETLK
jgi:hypothetical protein